MEIIGTFSFTKSSFCLGKTCVKGIEIQNFFKFWSVTFEPWDGAKTLLKMDHSAIYAALEKNILAEQEHGPSFWKFNNGLFTYIKYCMSA